MKHPFTDEELLEIFEFACEGMNNDNIFGQIAIQMDLADETLIVLRNKLEDFLNTETK
jgi:hypothetical protein